MEAEEDEAVAVENTNEPSLDNYTTPTAAADMHAQEEPQNCEREPELDRSQLSDSRESTPPQQPLQLEEEEGGDVFVKEEEELVNDVAAESRLGEEGGGSDESRQPEGGTAVAWKIGGGDLARRQESGEVDANGLAAESRRGEEEGGNVELRPPEAAPSVAGKSGGEDLIGGEETEGVGQTLEAGQQLAFTGERDDKESADREENKVVVNSLNSPTPLEHMTARDDNEDEDVVGGASPQVGVEPKMEIKTEETIPGADKVVDVAEEIEMPDVVEDAEVAEEKKGIDGNSSPAVEPKIEATTAGILEENKVSGLAPEGDLMEKIGGHVEAEKAKEKEVEKMEENEEKEVSKVAVEREVADVAEKLESEENKISGLVPEGYLLEAEKAEGKGEEKEVVKMEVRNGEKEVSEAADVTEKLVSKEADIAEGMETVEGRCHNLVEETQREGGEIAAGIGKEEVTRMEDADMEMPDVVEAIDNVEKTDENGVDEETENANVAEEAGKVQESATEVTDVAEEMDKEEVEEPEMMEESEMADAAEETETVVEETVAAEETEVEEASRSAGGKRKRGKSSKAPVRAPVKKKTEEDVCFICFDGGDLVLCDRR